MKASKTRRGMPMRLDGIRLACAMIALAVTFAAPAEAKRYRGPVAGNLWVVNRDTYGTTSEAAYRELARCVVQGDRKGLRALYMAGMVEELLEDQIVEMADRTVTNPNKVPAHTIVLVRAGSSGLHVMASVLQD